MRPARSLTVLLFVVTPLALPSAGCDGPEAVRTRGQRGADVGNYPGLPLPVPSKIDATKDLSRFRETTDARP